MLIAIDYPQKMLQMCGISQSELEEQICLLEKHFGAQFIEAILRRRGGLSLSLINQICERSVLAESLALAPGFKTVRKKIVDRKSSSLDEPHGEWFQLTVGYLLKSIKEHPQFEQKINSNPKDILIRNSHIHIECKSFRDSEVMKKALDKLIKSGDTPTVASDSPDGFNVSYGVICSIPGWPPNPSCNVNEYQRFFEKGILEKRRQLLNGKCNLIAFNSELFVGDVGRFRETLQSVLQKYPNISGLLAMRREHGLPGDPYTLLGSAYACEVITNQQAEIAISTDLLLALRPQVIRIALRP